jgi:hypothetical protein
MRIVAAVTTVWAMLGLWGAVARADLFTTGRPVAFVHHFDASGHDLGTFPPGSPFQTEELNSITRGPDGALYMLDNLLGRGRVFRFDPWTGVVDSGYTPFESPELTIPFGIAFDATGALYVGSTRFFAGNIGQTAVLRRDPISKRLQTYVSLTIPNGRHISDLAIGGDQSLYVAIPGAAVQRFVDQYLDRSIISLVGRGNDGSAIAIGPDGDLYLGTEAAGVQRYDPLTGALLGTFVAPGMGGIAAVNDVLFAPDGYLYVSSSSVGKIARFDPLSGSYVDTFVSVPPLMPGSGGGWEIAYVVPEPSSLALIGSVGLSWGLRRRAKGQIGRRPAVVRTGIDGGRNARG